MQRNFRKINTCQVRIIIKLLAYFHFEKSSGTIIADITDNNLEGYITVTKLNNNDNIENEDNNISDESIWSSVLEEFEPIEYEDKWGRKGTGAHAIKFSSMNFIIIRIS